MMTPAQRAARVANLARAREARRAALSNASERPRSPLVDVSAATRRTARMSRMPRLRALDRRPARIGSDEAFTLYEAAQIPFDELVRLLSTKGWRFAYPRRRRNLRGRRWGGWCRERSDAPAEPWAPPAQQRLLYAASHELGGVPTGLRFLERCYHSPWARKRDLGYENEWRRMRTALDDARGAFANGSIELVMTPGTRRFATHPGYAREYVELLIADGLTVYFVADDILVPGDSDWEPRFELALERIATQFRSQR